LKEFGLRLNEFLLTLFCYEPFKECMNRPSGSTSKRADMVISVHPLCQDIPLKILKDLDGGVKRTTPFVTVVTDLGGAHKTWFNPGYGNSSFLFVFAIVVFTNFLTFFCFFLGPHIYLVLICVSFHQRN
jgi:hypothetical protein